jgi:hypothetical protein
MNGVWYEGTREVIRYKLGIRDKRGKIYKIARFPVKVQGIRDVVRTKIRIALKRENIENRIFWGLLYHDEN